MKVAVSGIHGSGKSTIFNTLKELPNLQHFTFVPGIARVLKTMGISINKEGNNITQAIIMTCFWKRIDTPGNVIYERSVLDGYAYTIYHYRQCEVSAVVANFARQVFEQTKDKYDMFFFVRPEFDLVSDGVREMDKNFHGVTTKIYEEIIDNYKLPVKILTGTPEERITQFMESITRHEIRK